MNEDEAALLAELQAISNKSAASRFEDDVENVPQPQQEEKEPRTQQMSETAPSQKETTSTESSAVLANESSGYGIKPDIPSTFQGKRGGAAEDPELIALLRGVSSKSSGATRFADNDDNQKNNNGDHKHATAPSAAMSETVVETPRRPEIQTNKLGDDSSLPPWKRKGARKTTSQQPDVEVVVAAPPLPAPEVTPAEETQTLPDERGIKSEIPSTFQGERGGAAEDPELLALLRGVSVKSSSASRFAEEDENANSSNATSESLEATRLIEKPKPTVPAKRSDTDSLPPWKRKGAKKSATSHPEVDVVVAAPLPDESVGFGIKSETPSTFQGERGGAAEDAELLALLRGVSAKSSSASRFVDDRDNHDATLASAHAKEETLESSGPSTSVSQARPSDKDNLPPWKQKGRKQSTSQQPDVLVVAAPPAPAVESNPLEEKPDEIIGFGIKSNIPSSFQGERGGAAEDPELLALLRGVSAKSSGASRFAEKDENTNSSNAASEPLEATRPIEEPKPKLSTRTSDRDSLPPWKQKGARRPTATQSKANVVVASSPPPALVPAAGPTPQEEVQHLPGESVECGIKSKIPSSFQGERGGAAEDAELLALLRGVSAKSSGANPFAEEADEQENKNNSTVLVPSDDPRKRGPQKDPEETDPQVSIASEPASASTGLGKISLSAADESLSHGIKSDIPSTFKGERGGEAEDPELLALLRGVSSGAASSRFSDETSTRSTKALSEKPSSVASPVPSRPSAPKPATDEIEISRDDVPQALKSKNWKERAKAFELLDSLLCEAVKGKDRSEIIDSDTLLPGLDSLLPSFVEDTHPATLDKALEFCLNYAEYCRGAGIPENARSIVSSLLNKNGFSSRPSTAKLATSLSLKLMEVGQDGPASLQAIIEVIINDGLSSRKPKVVQASTSLIFESMMEFGAGHLPLLTLINALPMILSHTNAKVREDGLKIVSELCRTLGSKSALQDVIDTMKKAQTSELDKLLTDQPQPSPIRTGLRSLGSDPGSLDAMPALASQAKQLDEERFAARPAVNLIATLAETDYSTRIAHQKWSEKVAALKIVLECGGEKPYKLAQPSSSVNYIPLISDMKKLLSHSHFAVCTHAMQVLSMLAEGVGETLFPYLRPLLTPLLQLSKDKKLNRGVAGCLDSFFGKVLGFDHLLDEDDGLPVSLDEKKERNALARASAMDYLKRSVERCESAGPRGGLCGNDVERIASLCTLKLSDSDASVRKAAIEVLRSLQKNEDPAIMKICSATIDSLKTDNPRAYKTLAKTDTTGTQTTIPGDKNRKTQSTKNTEPGALVSRLHVEARGPVASKSRPSVSKPESCVDGPPDTLDEPSLENAFAFAATLSIPQWLAPEDDGGVASGLESSKWLSRQNAIQSITAHVESGRVESYSSEVQRNSSCLLKVVKERTRGFKETNVNIMKAIISLFTTVCEYHEAKEIIFPAWATRDGVVLAVHKISDRKLSSGCKELLTKLCVVSEPSTVLDTLARETQSAKSPIVHEESLRWFQSFSKEFGALSVGPNLSSLIPWVLEEIGSSNPKVKREASSLMAALFRQIGPKLKALSMSLAKNAETKRELESCFNDSDYNPSALPSTWPRQSIVNISPNGTDAGTGSLHLDLPKTDLFSLLPSDIVNKMGSTDGKAAWKQRKEALEETDNALSSCSGLIEAGSQLKKLAGLIRALRDRLTDTQINLKPVAARVLGKLLSLLDKTSQAKLGKLAYGPLLNGAMSDIKKTMRDACIEALRLGTSEPAVDGGGVNAEAMEALVTALVTSVNETALRSGGLPEVLLFLLSITEKMPNLDAVSVRGQALGPQFASVIVECLTSSKSETRAAATSLLESTIMNGIITPDSIRQAIERLKPAKQRSVAPLVAKFAQKAPDSNSLGKQDTTINGGIAPPGVPKSKLDRSTVERKTSLADKIPQVKSPHFKSKAGSVEDKQSKNDGKAASRHPLAPRSSSSRPSTHGLVWPEYPEEPQGSTLLGTLKKSWSSIIPPNSIAVLFPNSGIRKQDDANMGCELLLAALKSDRRSGNTFVKDQLEFIVKWLAFVLCSRETTVGLQSFLGVAQEFFSYLRDLGVELTDSVALEIVPYIFDKASNVKGRFKDAFLELVALLRLEELLPAKRLGSVVSVAIIERSTHARARAMACHMCQECIDLVGLSACGKRGVLAAAKLLSEEKVPESKMAALDLMETILSRMNGDTQRLTRICGPNLSDKALDLVEEKWQKRGTTTRTPARMPKPERPSGDGPTPPHPSIGSPDGHPSLFDELPALSLRSGGREPVQRRSAVSAASEPLSAVFAFPRDVKKTAEEESNIAETDILVSSSREPESTFLVSSRVETEIQENLGTASSLRARLMKIREKTKAPVKALDAIEEKVVGGSPPTMEAPTETAQIEIFEEEMNVIRSLVAKEGPFPENHPDLQACIDTLKRFHAALSKQQKTEVGMTVAGLSYLRKSIGDNMELTVEQLTRLISFAFDCGEEHVNSMMSIPLLSVCLAVLMALFRDPQMSKLVTQDDLALLIRETGAALLDDRLTATSELDEATASQMARAINKLAVQAATGATRHVALLALMALQQQISLEITGSYDSETFSSRLSRVVSKLFIRVIKVEEGSSEPYAPNQVDMEAILCSVEDMLAACQEAEQQSADTPAEALDVCRQMADALVQSIAKSQGLEFLLGVMEQLGIGPDDSCLGQMIVFLRSGEINTEREGAQKAEPRAKEEDMVSSNSLDQQLAKGSSKDVASLVSALASSSPGPEREAALEALRSYKKTYGDDELNAFLQPVSASFRAFIEELLGTDESKAASSSTSRSSMSERLQTLRSRLQVTELVVQTAVEEAPGDNGVSRLARRPGSSPSQIPTPNNQSSRQTPTRLAQPSPSLLPGSTAISLQDRLSSAQEKQSKTTVDSDTHSGGAGETGTSMGRAAALRARLEAVKQKSRPDEM